MPPSAVVPDSMPPPARFADATFGTYEAGTPSQAEARDAARRFADRLRTRPSFTQWLRRLFGSRTRPDAHGLYFVGPVGTGKTHLLAAMYHALHPAVPCAFLHSSTLFRTTVPPDRYAAAVAARYEVLCLDEVEIDDPANEVRLVRMLRALEQHRVRLLATSNVTPEQFMANRMGPGRFERFLQNEFSARHRIVYVGGDDYRRHARNGAEAQGRAWIGPAAEARAALRDAYRTDAGDRCWMTFDALREASRTTAHARLLDRLTACDSLYVAGIAITNTDDALRLLRIVDDLYVRPDAPRLYLSATEPPKRWFDAADQTGLAADVADKFTRTISRLHALCTVERLDEEKEGLGRAG